jgi:hypothetical protein
MIGAVWGMKPGSSQVYQTLAALKAFGLLEGKGSGMGITEDGRTYLLAQQESIKHEIIRRIALRPKQIQLYLGKWGIPRPKDPHCLDDLVLNGGFSREGAEKFLSVYDATIAYAGVVESDKTLPIETQKASGNDENDPPPPPSVGVGDYVQWTSGGVDQFQPPRRVVGIFGDGTHVQVFGSNTGIPMSELVVVPAPSLGAKVGRTESGSAWAHGENDFNVLQTGDRLQITADVNLEGIATLKEMLGDYESILRRLQVRRAK